MVSLVLLWMECLNEWMECLDELIVLVEWIALEWICDMLIGRIALRQGNGCHDLWSYGLKAGWNCAGEGKKGLAVSTVL